MDARARDGFRRAGSLRGFPSSVGGRRADADRRRGNADDPLAQLVELPLFARSGERIVVLHEGGVYRSPVERREEPQREREELFLLLAHVVAIAFDEVADLAREAGELAVAAFLVADHGLRETPQRRGA